MTVKLRKSHPAWVCGLKLSQMHPTQSTVMSHPAWVCGLKHSTYAPLTRRYRSHPAWVCGLKQYNSEHQHNSERVTPCVGVWIETQSLLSLFLQTASHPAWVCGLKQAASVISLYSMMSHPAWVCGLKHVNIIVNPISRGHTLRGCVD